MTAIDGARLLILDGNNLVMRNYFATLKANLTAPDGRASGALYGTIKTFFGYVRELRPTHCIWTFDDGASDMRVALRADYKGHRKYSSITTPKDNDLSHQYLALRQFFNLIGVAHHSQRGVEADDLIARIVRGSDWPAQVDDTVIVSSDHDLLQLVNLAPSVKVHRPGEQTKAGGVGLGRLKPQLHGVDEVVAKYGLEPHRLPEMWALTGDTGDNIKGIPGVGPVTATKWLNKHHFLSTVLAYEDKCAGYERICDINRQMIELDGTVGDLPPYSLDDCELSPIPAERIEGFLGQWAMQSLADKAVVW